jgi:hypothetical protein
MGNYAGVDWATEKHDVLVADEAGELLLSATFQRMTRRGLGRCAASWCVCVVLV